MKFKIIFSAILILGVVLRFNGLNWDQSQHLHPDERFLTMVANGTKWPDNLAGYFDTQHSPLNPHNQNFNFFVYGTFPLFLTKAVAEILKRGDYEQLTLVGRFLSALFDIGTVMLVFLLGKKIFSKAVGLLGSAVYAISVLPIQLSHFLAVDTFLNFFMLATLTGLVYSISSPKLLFIILAGLTFGLALGSKVTAVLLLPIILFIFLVKFKQHPKKTLVSVILFGIISLLIFRLVQPYAFAATSAFDWSINPLFLANLKELQTLSQATVFFPPSVQWINTTPFLYPLRDIILWGLGLPLGLIALASIFWLLIHLLGSVLLDKKQLWNRDNLRLVFLLLPLFSVFVYQGLQAAKPMRYFLPVYPFAAILTSFFLLKVLSFMKKNASHFLFHATYYLLLTTCLIWPLSFVAIYNQSHSRVQASEWIYQNIPSGALLSSEVWDDSLPLSLKDQPATSYLHIEFPLYHPDNLAKWEEMSQKLNQVDYIILSSNRLYGSITRVPEDYPQTAQFYQSLFDSSLGFVKVAEFTSRPRIPIPFLHLCLRPPLASYGIISFKQESCPDWGLTIIDDYADESFTVYDHPKVVIFGKKDLHRN